MRCFQSVITMFDMKIVVSSFLVKLLLTKVYVQSVNISMIKNFLEE